MTIRDSFRLHTTQFEYWVHKHGIILCPKIKLADLRYRSAGRGVLATADIEADEDLFTIPRSAILTIETSSIPRKFLEGVDEPWLALIMAMIYEDKIGFQSPWCNYLGVLPTEFDTLMFWSETELDQLKGSAVLDKIGHAKAEHSFATKILPVITANKDDFLVSWNNDEQIMAMCHRMASIIMAYAFDVETGTQSDSDSDGESNNEDNWQEDDEGDEHAPQVGLVPMADMLNADAERNNAKLFYMDDKVVMRSIKKIKQGEEILNDYGPLPRADLLRRYGYITEEYAKYDVVELSTDFILDTASKTMGLPTDEALKRVDYLEGLDLPMDAFDVAHSSAEDGQFPDELKVLLNALILSTSEFDQLVSKQGKPSRSLSSSRPQGIELLRTILQRRLEQYGEPSQPQELEPKTARRWQMAAQVIAGEKHVLHEALHDLDGILGAAQSGSKRGATQDQDQGSGTSKKLKR